MQRNKPSIEIHPGSQTSGKPISTVTYNPNEACLAYRAILAEIDGVPVNRAKGVVWVSGDHELIVRIPSVRMVFQDGFILVGIPVYCEQTGDAEVVVSFAVGRPALTLGLIVATENRPRGPDLVVDAWGDPLTAFAWQGLVRLAEKMAANVRMEEKQGLPLLPVALSASADGVSILLAQKLS